MPSSPRGWLCWAVSVSDRYGRPYSPRYEYEGFGDRRVSSRREEAIDVTNALDRATNGNGAGKLLRQFYVEEASWYSFTPHEQHVLRETIRAFRRELQRAGFIGPEGEGEL